MKKVSLLQAKKMGLLVHQKKNTKPEDESETMATIPVQKEEKEAIQLSLLKEDKEEVHIPIKNLKKRNVHQVLNQIELTLLPVKELLIVDLWVLKTFVVIQCHQPLESKSEPA